MGDLIRQRIALDPEAFSWARGKRSPGLHQSEVIDDILQAIGHKKGNGAEWTDDKLEPYRMQGFLWEQVFTEQLQHAMTASDGTAFGIERTEYIHLPEIAVSLRGDDAFVVEPGMTIPLGYLLMSPDGAAVNPWRLLEMKWTTKSVTMQPERDREDWFIQVKGYLEGLSRIMGRTREVEWYVCFPCGDYKGSGTCAERWTKEFSDNEIADNFAMLSQHVYDRVHANPNHPWARWV